MTDFDNVNFPAVFEIQFGLLGKSDSLKITKHLEDAMSVATNVKGMDAVTKLTQEYLGSKSGLAIAAALTQISEEVITEAKEGYVPVDTGALRNTGHVEEPKVDEKEVVVTLGFGGGNVSYALAVHENMEAQHPVGQAKYLEIPLMSRANSIPEEAAEIIRQSLGL